MPGASGEAVGTSAGLLVNKKKRTEDLTATLQ